MDPTLVQLITDLVIAELGRGAPPSGETPARPTSSRGSRRLLLVPAPPGWSESDPIWLQIKQIPDVDWTAVRVEGVCSDQIDRALGAVRWVAPPTLWDDLVRSVQALVLPVFRLEVMTRLALLLGDVPATGAAIAAIMQGVPVYASAHEVERVRRASGRLPGPFLSTFHQHLRGVEGLGVQVLEAEVLCQRLTNSVASSGFHSTAHKGRDVITVSDLEAAAAAGQKVLKVAPGTIITPLAREKAAQMQIEVSFS